MAGTPGASRPDQHRGGGRSPGRRTSPADWVVPMCVLGGDLAGSLAAVVALSRADDLPRFVVGSESLRYSTLGWALPLAWVLLVFLGGGYRPARVMRLSQQVRSVIRAVVGVLVVVAVANLSAKLQFSRGFVGASLLGVVGVAIAVRLLAVAVLDGLHRRGRLVQRVLVVGDHALAEPIMAHLGRRAGSGYTVVGRFVPPEAGPSPHGAVLSAAMAHRARTVVIVGSQTMGRRGARQVANHLTEAGLEVLIAPEIDEFGGPGVDPKPVADLLLLQARPAGRGLGDRVAKGLLDRVGGTVLLVLSAPLMVGLALAVRIESRGPALFRQERVGRSGRPFRIYKFRTMVRDAEQRLHADDLYDEYVRNGYKLLPEHDPRITRLGRFLRRTSLDELPQLLNVVRGHMSLVGPRPVLATELGRYGEHVGAYLHLKPGMTGYWQVNGRSEIGFPERAELDAYYHANRSIRLDLLILSRTVGTVLRRRGAH